MLPPEVEEGNHEYKRYFKDIKKKRFFEWSTQMCWRLEEGNGIAYYFIGVNDDGTIFNKLNKKQIKYSFKILNNLTGKCNSKITKIENNNEDDKEWFKVEIKRLKSGVKFKTLDGDDIDLHEDDLMICDGNTPMCIAGVYGGKNHSV